MIDAIFLLVQPLFIRSIYITFISKQIYWESPYRWHSLLFTVVVLLSALPTLKYGGGTASTYNLVGSANSFKTDNKMVAQPPFTINTMLTDKVKWHLYSTGFLYRPQFSPSCYAGYVPHCPCPDFLHS